MPESLRLKKFHDPVNGLQTRDVESVRGIDARIVLARDSGQEKEMRGRFERFQRIKQELARSRRKRMIPRNRKPCTRSWPSCGRNLESGGKRIEFSGSLRWAMRCEAEMMFPPFAGRRIAVCWN